MIFTLPTEKWGELDMSVSNTVSDNFLSGQCIDAGNHGPIKIDTTNSTGSICGQVFGQSFPPASMTNSTTNSTTGKCINVAPDVVRKIKEAGYTLARCSR